ncbi:leucine zipper protein 1-like [Papaver somniferum]|uniref:leucine zipper protein 1-like n=1 Tax=Papaver somniferum TaxID=3469 RepID=UPI000E704437|nr:leucine zipper protein 1-like [Papaver somniferum]
MPDEYELHVVCLLKYHKETGVTGSPAPKQRQRKVLDLDVVAAVRKATILRSSSTPNKPQPLQYRATSSAKVPDPPVHLKFLQNVYVKAREDPSMRSRALESLVTLSADDFLFLESSVMLSASMDLSLQQYAALMTQEVNRHMANLVDTRLVREKAKNDEALIKSLAKELKEEKEHSSKQRQKMEKLLSKSLPSQIISLPLSLLFLFSYVIFRQARCMQRQANASESAASLEDMRAENLNLMTQNDCYVSENTILNEKVETHFSQVDCLSIDCSHDDNERLKLELERVNNSLFTSSNLHLSSIATFKRLEEDYERDINSKIKVVSNLRRSRNKVTDLNEEVDRLKTKMELLPLQDSDLKISELDHLYTYIQETLNTTLLHLEESEERHKSQVLRLSNERDESRLEASRLQNEVGDLNADLDEMMETSAKVTKLSRKNTQNYLVPLFDAYCDEHGILHPFFPLEVFSDDEQPKDDEIVPGEEDGFSEDGEEQKVVDTKAMEEDSKEASSSTDAGLGGARDKIPETTVTDDASPQQ